MFKNLFYSLLLGGGYTWWCSGAVKFQVSGAALIGDLSCLLVWLWERKGM